MSCPFSQFVNKLLDKHAPYKIIKYSKTGYETKPWITAGLANSIYKKHRNIQKLLQMKRSKNKRIL